jgi:hypothetical protein
LAVGLSSPMTPPRQPQAAQILAPSLRR